MLPVTRSSAQTDSMGWLLCLGAQVYNDSVKGPLEREEDMYHARQYCATEWMRSRTEVK